MHENQHRFLSLTSQMQARLTVEQVAWMLNCPPHSIAALNADRLLKSLGDPPVNGIKFFCTAEVQELIKNGSWLAKVTNSIIKHTKNQNDRKMNPPKRLSRNGYPLGMVDSITTAKG